MGNGSSQGLPMAIFANQYRISDPSEPGAQTQVHGLPVTGLKIDPQNMPADVLPVLDHFKKVFGYDMTQLKQEQFACILNIIRDYEPVYENTDVVPTQDTFNKQVENLFQNYGLDPVTRAKVLSYCGIAYKYFYNETTPGEKASKVLGAIGGTGADAGGQSWSDWISSMIGGTTASSATAAAGAASESISAAVPMATSRADYMSSVAPVGTALPEVKTPGAAPKPGSASSITPGNPKPDWSAYSNNLSALAETTALATTPTYGTSA